MGGFGTFAAGVAAALVAQALAPALARRGRPVAREAIKQLIILGDGARARAEGLREDLRDLAEEAREGPRPPQDAAGDGPGAQSQ